MLPTKVLHKHQNDILQAVASLYRPHERGVQPVSRTRARKSLGARENQSSKL